MSRIHARIKVRAAYGYTEGRRLTIIMKDFAKRFYLSTAWRRTREAYYRYRCGLCERCGNAGDIVHHKKYLTPTNIHDPAITLSFANLELLCQECHNKEHFEKPNERYRFDADGNVIPPTSEEQRSLGEPV